MSFCRPDLDKAVLKVAIQIKLYCYRWASQRKREITEECIETMWTAHPHIHNNLGHNGALKKRKEKSDERLCHCFTQTRKRLMEVLPWLFEQGTQDFAESIIVAALLHAEQRGEKGENEAKVETFKFLLLPCISKTKKDKNISTNFWYFLIASPAVYYDFNCNIIYYSLWFWGQLMLKANSSADTPQKRKKTKSLWINDRGPGRPGRVSGVSDATHFIHNICSLAISHWKDHDNAGLSVESFFVFSLAGKHQCWALIKYKSSPLYAGLWCINMM